MEKLYGVAVAMVTPMDEQGRLCEDAVAQLAEKLIQRGVQCLFPCGTTGEMLKLSAEERKRVAEIVVRTAKKRVRVFVHVGAAEEATTAELAKHAYRIGADGVSIVTPQFFGCKEEALEGYYARIAEQLPEDFPIYLYNIPQCSANDISAASAKRLYEKHSNIVGIKYSFTDLSRTTQYLDIDPDFSVVHGCDRLFSSMLILGCDGTVSGVSGVFPEPFVRVYEAYLRRDMEQVQYWQKAAREICDILRCGTDLAYFKTGLEYRGVAGGSVRLPQLNLTESERGRLYDLLEDFCQKYAISRSL